jgi:phenylalanine-4-hydroxylase
MWGMTVVFVEVKKCRTRSDVWAPHVELIRQNSPTHYIRQFDNVTNIVNHSPLVFQDSLSHFCHIFGRGSC